MSRFARIQCFRKEKIVVVDDKSKEKNWIKQKNVWVSWLCIVDCDCVITWITLIHICVMPSVYMKSKMVCWIHPTTDTNYAKWTMLTCNQVCNWFCCFDGKSSTRIVLHAVLFLPSDLMELLTNAQNKVSDISVNLALKLWLQTVLQPEQWKGQCRMQAWDRAVQSPKFPYNTEGLSKKVFIY